MNQAEQIRHLRNALYAIVNALGASLPRTPEVKAALAALIESDIQS